MASHESRQKITYSVLKGLFPLDIGVVDIKKENFGLMQFYAIYSFQFIK